MATDQKPLSQKWPRWVLLVAIVPACWLGMMAVHELGHVFAAWLVGAKVERVILHPLAFSRTDVAGSNWPRLIVWMGPLVGMTMPMTLWLAARAMCLTVTFLFQFFAGFCLLANGAYLASVLFEPVGDTADLLRLGESPVLICLFGLPCMIAGVMMWSGLASSFGWGPSAKDVSPRVAVGVVLVLVVMVVAEFVLSASA